MAQIDVHNLSDHAKFNGFHGMVLFWCALIIIFDGYDLAVAGIALPSIMKEMGVTPATAGYMVSSALFGMMFGAIFLGTVADKIGRRWAIVICIVLFSAFTAAAGMTTDPVSFSVTRFLAGLGIGGVMPNVVAQMTEYSPRKMRSTLVTLMFSGYAVGGMLAAVLGKGLIESYGWSYVFFAAAAPMVLIPFVLKSLPESMPFLIKTGRIDELKAIVQRLEPSYTPSAADEFALPAAHKAHGAPIGNKAAPAALPAAPAPTDNKKGGKGNTTTLTSGEFVDTLRPVEVGQEPCKHIANLWIARPLVLRTMPNNRLADCSGIGKGINLGKHANRQATAVSYAARIWLMCLCQKLEQGGLTVTVAPDHTNAVAVVHTNGYVVENGFGWELETDCLGSE